MQLFGVLSFLFCVVCMYCIFRQWEEASYMIFAISIAAFMVSLVLSLVEIFLSTKALEVALSDIEEVTRTNFLVEILRGKEDKEG